MKHLLSICILMTCNNVILFAQEPNIVWTQTIGGTLGDIGYSIEQTQDGGFIIAGSTYSFGAGWTDAYLVKTDPFGNEEWHKAFGTPAYDNAYSVQQTTDGGFILTGMYNDDGIQGNVYLIKTNSLGEMQWWKSIGPGPAEAEEGRCVKQTTDGGYIITGLTAAYDAGDVYLVKTDALGNVEWTQHYGPLATSPDVGHCVLQTSDRGYIIVGQVYNYANGWDVWLIKTDEYGYIQWDKKFGRNDNDRGYCVQQTQPDGGYIINGYLRDVGDIFMWLIKTDALGNLIWDKRLKPAGPSAALGYSVRQTEDHGYIAIGEAMITNHWDLYAVKTDENGNIEWAKTVDRDTKDDHGYAVAKTYDGGYVIAGATTIDPYNPPYNDVYLIKLGQEIIDTDDPLALAYNGNRHLVRKPNSQELHLVYTGSGNVIYRYSSDGGTNWSSSEIIGDGKFPVITLSSDYLPSVAWTDDIGGLWYKRKILQNQWSEIYHLYDPWSIGQPRLNSPPSIVITPSSEGDSVHVLMTLHVSANGPANWVAEYSFRIDIPTQGLFSYIEGGSGYPQAGAIRYNPSIARCEQNNSLHAVWQRADTICYATRQLNQTWNNWGPRFGDEGLFSARPFVETYGDMIYVVWQHKEMPSAPEEVYKGWRNLSELTFNNWINFSRTTDTWSLYPVNVSGWFTVYTDYISPFPDHGADIFYKIDPDDIAYNISQTADASSFYPQCSARFISGSAYLYTAWLDGDMPPYRIHFKRLQYIPADIPYITSINGHEIPSPYLIARDSFMPGWQVPVDVGNETITYRFQLDPEYRYILKAIAYHQSSGEWREWIKVDDRLKHQIKYKAYEPETLEFWIPSAYYRDSLIEIAFDRISGDFATAGTIEIYRYEYEEGEGEGEPRNGPMAYGDNGLEDYALNIYPNPFTTKLNIHYEIPDVSRRISIKVYDTAGRLRKNLSKNGYDSNGTFTWNGQDEFGRTAAPGIYFLTIENLDTRKIFCCKILKLE
jgi:hypothetical protein